MILPLIWEVKMNFNTPGILGTDDRKMKMVHSACLRLIKEYCEAGQSGQPGQPGQPQQNQQPTSQQAAQKLKQAADLTKNITGLKSLDPTLNIQKTVDAIEKDPQHVTAADAEALAHVVNAIEPMLKNNQAAAGLTSNLKRMATKGPQ